MSETGMSRRRFLTGAAVVAAAAAVPAISNVAEAGAAPAITFPLATDSWTPLDATAVARVAYELYKGKYAGQAACCEATYWPIIGELGNRYPTTWGLIPKGLFNFGGGGVNGWGASCGCVNGGPALLRQIGAPTGMQDEYLQWYSDTLLPTNAAYIDYRSGAWVPGGSATGGWGNAANQLAIPYNNAPKSRAKAILCHASVTQWRVAGGSWEETHTLPPAQPDRCAKLCYDCVYKLATMINEWKAGKTVWTPTLDPSVTACKTAGCHAEVVGQGHPVANGKMPCTTCHPQRVGDNHNL